MIIERLVGRLYKTNCYVVIIDNKALIIDPCVKIEEIERVLNGAKVVGLLLTHGHIDHFYHIDEVKKYYGLKIHANKLAKEKLDDPNKNQSVLSNNPIKYVYPHEDYVYVTEKGFEIDGIKIGLIETPGHTDCSICFKIDNVMFTGDTLFAGYIGRTDLYSASSYSMQKSLEKLKKLKDDFILYPGHDQPTTLSHEKATNKYLLRIK